MARYAILELNVSARSCLLLIDRSTSQATFQRRRANSRANASALKKTNYARTVIVAYDDPSNSCSYRFVSSFIRAYRADTNQESDSYANQATGRWT